MDHALNLLNVIVSSAGHLAKFRLPTALTTQVQFPVAGKQGIIDTFFDFQQANGTRQLVFNAGPCIGYYIVNLTAGGVEIVPYVFNVIEDNNPLDIPRWSWVESNNLLFGANGQRMQKWDGAHWRQMGIGVNGVSPPAPMLGITVPLTTIQRAGNVVTFSVSAALQPTVGANFNTKQLENLAVNIPVTISGVVGDPTMNGNFALTAPIAIFQGNYSQVAANIGPFNNDGFVTIYYAVMAEPTVATVFDIINIIRNAGVTSLLVGPIGSPSYFQIMPGESLTVTGLTGAAANGNGTYPLAISSPPSYNYNQPGLPDIPFPGISFAIGAGPQISGGYTNVVAGRTWRYAYANSITGHVGPGSLPSFPLPGGGLGSNLRAFLTAPGTLDPQIDTIWWFGPRDGGGDYGKLIIAPIAPGGAVNVLSDGIIDKSIDLTQQAPLLNFAPPIGSKFGKFQGRLFLAGINGAPQDIAYSGYEQVLVGRPEESWLPNNRLRLAIGADDIRGFGVIMPGVVAFSHSNQMFMFQGQVEDITTTLPVNFSAQMQELPWETGCTSHAAIQPTPYGIVWVGSDLTVKIWNGIFYGTIIGPRDLSVNIYPLMHRITPGTYGSIQSAFFNWVERDWFVINVCLDGSQVPNYLIFFSLSQEDSDNLGVFIANTRADSLGVREGVDGQRHLIISSGGIIYELKAASTQTNGINQTITSTTGYLNAYWESGYLGSDSPQTVKMFRYGHLITDQGGFNLITKLVDDGNYTLVHPLAKALRLLAQKFTVNRNARRSNLTIIFPSQDIDAAVQELNYSYIPGSER